MTNYTRPYYVLIIIVIITIITVSGFTMILALYPYILFVLIVSVIIGNYVILMDLQHCAIFSRTLYSQ